VGCHLSSGPASSQAGAYAATARRDGARAGVAEPRCTRKRLAFGLNRNGSLDGILDPKKVINRANEAGNRALWQSRRTRVLPADSCTDCRRAVVLLGEKLAQPSATPGLRGSPTL